MTKPALLSSFFLVTFLGACAQVDLEQPTISQPQPSATPQEDSIGTLTHSSGICSLALNRPSTPTGSFILHLGNDTDSEAAFDMWRIAGEHTYEEFSHHIAEEVRLADAGETGLGPPSYAVGLVTITSPPGESEIRLNLFTPGVYVVVCFDQYLQAGWRPSDLLGPLVVE